MEKYKEFSRKLVIAELQNEQGLVKFLNEENLLSPIKSIDCNNTCIVMITQDNQIFIMDINNQINRHPQKKNAITEIHINSKMPIENVKCGVNHYIFWNTKQIYGYLSPGDKSSCNALGFNQVDRENKLKDYPKKIPIFLSNEQVINDVICGLSVTILKIGEEFYGFGDNYKNQLGFVLKDIVTEPQLIRLTSNNFSPKRRFQTNVCKNPIKVGCGNQFIIGLDNNGKLYGAGLLNKIGFKTQIQLSNGLQELSFHENLYENQWEKQSDESFYDKIGKIQNFQCKDDTLGIVTTDHQLIIYQKDKNKDYLGRSVVKKQKIDIALSFTDLILSNSLAHFSTESSEQFICNFQNSFKPQFKDISTYFQDQIIYKLVLSNKYLILQLPSSSFQHLKPQQKCTNHKKNSLKNLPASQKSGAQKIKIHNPQNMNILIKESQFSDNQLQNKVVQLQRQVKEQKQIIHLYELYVKKLQKQLQINKSNEKAQIVSDKEQILKIRQKMQKGQQKFRDVKYLLQSMIQTKI